MLGFIKGDTDVGVYSAAIKINRIAISVISSIGTVLVPRLSYYMGHGNKEQFMSLNTKVYQFVFMFSIPICIGIFMLSDEIVRIFCGNGFEDAGVTMKLLTPILLVIPISSVISNQTFFPLGKEKCILISTCIGAVTNFMLNTVLIPKYSYKGAAIATVIAESMVLLVCMIQLKRLFSIKRIFKGYYQYWMAALPIILIVYFIQWCGFGDVFTILFSVIIAAIVYFGILLLCRNVFIIEIIQFIINRFHRIIEDRRI
jgi:O-antigen/teichoic acid export membrane protein